MESYPQVHSLQRQQREQGVAIPLDSAVDLVHVLQPLVTLREGFLTKDARLWEHRDGSLRPLPGTFLGIEAPQPPSVNKPFVWVVPVVVVVPA